MPKSFCTYIVASISRTLYIGVTSDLEQRVWQHKMKQYEGFAASYKCNRLVWFEQHSNSGIAIAREKQLKGWTRDKKIKLIQRINPTWEDLSTAWGKPIKPASVVSL
jgi:putative endonuclease